MAEKILLVDDEPNVLQSMRRQLRKRFEITTAESGDEALAILKDKGPFAVIVSDMRMPGMNGVQLLSTVKDSFPDTVRMMLTGNADQETASDAVNAGQIFRFLTKPCSTAVLATSLALAVRQHNLLTAEKELLNKTVKGSISVMAELLSLTNAAAFSSGYRIKPMVKHIAEELELSNPWQYEVAALMSQIGCITLPGDVLHKLHAGVEVLTDDEQQMYEKHAKVGSKLIRKIPRLEKVAGMIENQLQPFVNDAGRESSDEEMDLGAEILHAAIDYDLLRQQAVEHQLAIKKLRKKEGVYNPKVLDILEKYRPKNMHTIIKNISLKEIIPGMIAEENVCAKNGALLLPKGQGVTWHVIQSLINFKKQIGIIEPIVVRVAEQEEHI